MHRPFLLFAALSACLGVALGAFGAHGLRQTLTEAQMATYRTAVDYQMWHALGLGLIGALDDRYPGQPLLRRAGWLMLAGILLFSGSLYLLSLSGARWLGMVTPLGGTAFLAAWSMLAFFAFKLPSSPNPDA
jgi:uncharacterized membrane protein YgdD (TMEM256/DUF423 family)